MSNKTVYKMRVSLEEDLYRDIEIRGSHDLYQFAEIITRSFDFYFDHAFGFSDDLRGFYRGKEMYELFNDIEDVEPSGSGMGVEGTRIANVYKPKKKMLFLFDYGDDWMFMTECLGTRDAVPKEKLPRLVESKGQAPEQYPRYDEDEDETEPCNDN